MTPLALTVNQVAHLLQVQPNTILHGIDRGDIPAKKIGRIWRVPSSFVADYLGVSSDEADKIITDLVATVPAWGK